MKYLLGLVLLALALSCPAAIYMQTDSQGNVVYSDTPTSNNDASVNLPQSGDTISTLPRAATPNTNNSASASSESSAGAALPVSGSGYSTFSMLSPSDQQTFQNQDIIPVTVKIDPSLRQGDKVQLYLDGSPVGEATSDLSKLGISHPDRGIHQIYASLMDNNGITQKQTDPITIYIHYSALTTGSGGITVIPTGGGTPSSPGNGITASGGGNGITSSSGGNGITPSGGGNGVTPSASQGSGIVPPPRVGPPSY